MTVYSFHPDFTDKIYIKMYDLMYTYDIFKLKL